MIVIKCDDCGKRAEITQGMDVNMAGIFEKGWVEIRRTPDLKISHLCPDCFKDNLSEQEAEE